MTSTKLGYTGDVQSANIVNCGIVMGGTTATMRSTNGINNIPNGMSANVRTSIKTKGPIRVGFYDIERTIGKGNFAVVKLARHRITKNEVRFRFLALILCQSLVPDTCIVRLHNNSKEEDENENEVWVQIASE